MSEYKEEKHIIFNIQKFCIHDGPGIRTVVFFKGCPLKCEWCSNPESIAKEPEVLWDKDKCVRCLKCTQICEAFSYIDNNIVFDKYSCNACKKCIPECPTKALSLKGELKSINEIVEEVLKDKEFYDESGGGVTFSGGEVLFHYEFATMLAKELKKYDIHIAIETSGFASKEVFQNFIKCIDTILFDVKHHNNEQHIQHIGVSNKQILENLAYAILQNKEVLVRIPVIPGVNDSLKDAREFAELLKGIGVKEVELLPFHQFGQKKYDLLQVEYKMNNVKQLNKSELVEYKNIFENYGIIMK